jgi:non-specific serine/threonine protein kinase
MLGTTVSHYHIIEHLGAGGMGVVYKAEDTRLGRAVALKFLPPEWSRDAEARERFLREARAASALEDSQICTIHEIDETEDGRLFIAMAYYEGETLKERIEKGQLPIEEALDIASQVARGLQRAHGAGIIHRDIKPANLMLTEQGEVRILDFGLAKLAGDLSLTKAGSTLGTPHYMSPEQARGEATDARSDLWSLGVVLYEMLTGQRPFKGENAVAVSRSILDDQPASVSEIRPESSTTLDRIVKRLLKKERDDRYQDAVELCVDLASLRSPPQGSEDLTSDLESISPTRRRRRSAAIVLISFVAVLAVVMTWVLQQEADRHKPAEARPRIVVLPFENLGPPADAYFADGMTEEITARLAAVGGLQVISRKSAVQYAGTDKTIQQMGEELRVGYVLEGTVRWAREATGPSRIRITPQLIRVADDSHLWADTYDRVIDDVFAIQSEIAQTVTDQLGVTLAVTERDLVDSKPTDSLEAYQAYLSGRYYSTRPHFTDENWNHAMAAYHRAVELDPDFALAHAQLARGHALARFLRIDLTDERLAAAQAAADRALALAPESPRVHLALGYYQLRANRDFTKAHEEFELAERDLADNAEIFQAKGELYGVQGRFEDALRAYERAFDLHPRSADLATEKAATLWVLRRYPEALEGVNQAIGLAPTASWPRLYKAFIYWCWKGAVPEARKSLKALVDQEWVWARWAWYWHEIFEGNFGDALEHLESPVEGWLRTKSVAFPNSMAAAFVYDLQNRPDLAKESYEAALALLEPELRTSPEDPRLHASLGVVYAALGQSEEAVREGRVATELLPRSKDSFYFAHYALDLALIYTIVGKHEAGLAQLEYLLKHPGFVSIPYLEMHPGFDDLQDHPKFRELVEKYAPQD